MSPKSKPSISSAALFSSHSMSAQSGKFSCPELQYRNNKAKNIADAKQLKQLMRRFLVKS